MGWSRLRTVGGTVGLVLVLVLAGCSGGGVDGTPGSTATVTETPAATTGGTDAPADGGTLTDGERDAGGGELDRTYEFEDGEAYGYVVRLPNRTTKMSWVVTDTAESSSGPYQEISVNVSFGQYATNATATQAGIFSALISEGSVGGPFLYVRTPVVLAAGHELRVGNAWTIRGEDVTVGDGYDVGWDRATAEVTGTASVNGETCYTMDLQISGTENGPTSCVKADWPFALAVDTGSQDYRLAEFDRP